MTMTWLLLVYLLLPSPPQGANGVIAGEIRLPDGAIAAGVRVSAMSAEGEDLNATTVLGRITITDELGRYRLDSVSPGRYYIVAGALDAPTYYPGAGDLQSARIIAVATGSNVQGVDFRIPRMPAKPAEIAFPRGYVIGKVVTDKGQWPLFLPALYVYVENGKKTAVGADGVKIKGTGTFGAIPVSKNGTFTFFLEDGEYSISLITSLGDPLTRDDGYIVKSISSAGKDLLKEKLKVNRSTIQSITITLTPSQ